VTWALAGVGLGAAVLAVPTVRPIRAWFLLLPGFAFGLVGAELAGVWLVVVVGAAGGVAAAGGAAAPPGWVGLALALGAAGAFARQVVLAHRAAGLVDENLSPLDGRHAPRSRRRLLDRLAPFRLGDRAVVRHADLRYAPAGGRHHLLDVYTPRGGTRDAPVLIQIHGGAWMTGNKRTQGRSLMNRLARSGWVCVAINYRLSPRVRHPEHLIDCKRALAWVRDHVAEFGGDPARVSVTGGSAGAHLAALLALTANNPAFQPGFETVDTSVLACVSMYGAYALGELFALTGWGRRFGAWMGRVVAGVDERRGGAGYEAASPLGAIHPGAPPFLVCHGTGDNLVPVVQARAFVLALREAAQPDTVVYVELPGAPHAFDVVRSVRTAAALEGVERFLTWALPAAAGERPGDGVAATGPTTTARTAPS
jgi:acetyl esterase/lipase